MSASSDQPEIVPPSSSQSRSSGTCRPWLAPMVPLLSPQRDAALGYTLGFGAGITTSEARCNRRQRAASFNWAKAPRADILSCAAKAYAARMGDSEYVDAVRLLIGEEQRHARELAKFLHLAGIPLAEITWADTAFRWLRKRAGIEVCVSVLLTAEIIAKVYYAALGKATASPVLRRICEQILQDEVEHVRFQSERLALLRAARPRPFVAMQHLAASRPVRRGLPGRAAQALRRYSAPEATAFVVSGNRPGRKCACPLYHMTPVRVAAQYVHRADERR